MNYALPIAPGETFEVFLNRAMDVPMLSVEDELELISNIRRDGCQKSRHRLFMSNVRLVVKMAQIYKAYGLSQHDLVQEGLFGMITSLDKYKPEKGLRFGTYATGRIKAAMINYLTANLRSVRIITNNKHKKLFFNIGRYKRHGKWLSAEERELLAEELDVSVDDVKDMEGRLAWRDASLLTQEPDDDYEFSGSDVMPLACPSSTPDDLHEIESSDSARKRAIAQAMKGLTAQEIDILSNRYLADEDRIMTLNQLAERYGVSRQRIQQVEDKALKKMAGNQDLADVA